MGTRKLAAAATMALAVALALGVAVLAADTDKPADTLTGDRVLARFFEVSGGRDEFAKLQSQYVHATVELMANLKVAAETYQTRPNKVKIIMTSDQIGTIERGFDGKLFWEKGTMTGVRLLEGQELADAIRETAVFEKVTTWNDYYTKAEVIGSDSVAGAMCFKVRVVPKESTEQTWFFDKSSGLFVKMIMTTTTQMGTVPAEMTFSDYRKTGNVMTPFRVTTSAAGLNMAMVIDSVAHNIDIPDSIFTPPAEALELAKPKE